MLMMQSNWFAIVLHLSSVQGLAGFHLLVMDQSSLFVAKYLRCIVDILIKKSMLRTEHSQHLL